MAARHPAGIAFFRTAWRKLRANQHPFSGRSSLILTLSSVSLSG
jgi:hypothetical protein